MNADRILKHKEWVRTGNRNGWRMPTAPAWKRVPIIRHVRAIYAAFQVARFERQVAGIGINTGQDDWLLYGIFHGLERQP